MKFVSSGSYSKITATVTMIISISLTTSITTSIPATTTTTININMKLLSSGDYLIITATVVNIITIFITTTTFLIITTMIKHPPSTSTQKLHICLFSSCLQSSPYNGTARTRYDKPCRNACASHGENYFWCDTWDDSWDYCSPRAEEQRAIVRKGQLRYPCDGICDKRANSFKWCTVVSVADAEKEKYFSMARHFPCGEERIWEEEEPEEPGFLAGVSGWLIALIIFLPLLVCCCCIWNICAS